jgi:very-short-patch-repair endonuclease
VAIDLPDLDWYVDHVVVPGGPDGGRAGPIRSWQVSWATLAGRLRREDGTARGRAVARALSRGFVLTRAQARSAGLADAEVRRLIRAGTWSAPYYGVLAVTAPPDDRQRHALAATAVALARAACVSGPSAAVLHGLPLLREPGPVVLTTAKRLRMGRRGDVLVRSATLPASQRTTWYGAALTTMARTVADLARADRAAGLVAADAALHERLITPDDLTRAAESCAGWPGARGVRDVLRLASSLAESPLESLTRLLAADAGLPAPELQVWIGGYRVDLLWPAQRVIVECDGRVKYTRDELWREKRRQEQLERLGFRVVRALWADVTRRPSETAERIRHAMGHASRPS